MLDVTLQLLDGLDKPQDGWKTFCHCDVDVILRV